MLLLQFSGLCPSLHLPHHMLILGHCSDSFELLQLSITRAVAGIHHPNQARRHRMLTANLCQDIKHHAGNICCSLMAFFTQLLIY